MQTAEQTYLEQRKLARGDQDSIIEQPENTEAVDVSQDAPVEEVIESEVITNEEVAPEAEEPAEEVTAAQTNDEETDLFYLDLDGEEVSSTQIKEWKANGLMQADYTRKTQAHAEDVKSFKVKTDDFATKESELNDKLLTLEAMLSEDTKTADEIAEMREYEPEEYIKYTEKQSKLKEFVNSAKTATQQPSVDMNKVSADLFAAHPEWMDNGKQSQQFIDDTNLMTKYAETRGIDQAELSSFEAKHYEVMLDAARYKSQNSKNVAIEKKVRKAPVSTKPRAKANNSLQSEIDVAQKRFNKTGNDKDFLLLRRLNRQLK